MPRRAKPPVQEVPAPIVPETPVQEVPAPIVPEPGYVLGKGRYRWTVEQTREQVELVETLLVSHTSMRRIEEELKRRYGANRSRAVKLIARIRQRWENEDADKRTQWKQQQIRSLEKTLNQIDVLIAHRINEAQELRAAHARKERLKERVKDPPGHLLREKREYLELLADLTGTKAPAEVNLTHNVNVTAAVQMAIASLTSDETARYLDDMRQMEQLAQVAKSSGLLAEGTAQ